MNRRDALKTIAAVPLAGAMLPAAEACECGCDMLPTEINVTISDYCPCDSVPVESITLSNPDGDEFRYEWKGSWYRPVVDELPEGFPLGFRWDENLNIEEMRPGLGIVSPCCSE